MEKYSSVRNLIIISHGSDKYDQLILNANDGSTLGISETYIEETVKANTPCTIDYIDLQVCYAYLDKDNDGLTIASAFFASDNVKIVFASDGPMAYAWEYRLNVVQNLFCSIYRLERNEKKEIISHNCGPITSLVFWGG